MSKYFFRWVAAVAAGVALSHAVAQAALVTNTIASYNFDLDTVGSLPAGWSGATTANAFVTNSPSSSAPNSFANRLNLDNATYTAAIAFPAHNLANGDPDNRLSYSLDINVDYIDRNDSEGVRLRIFNGTSQIDVGTPRILRNGANWRFYNGLAGGNGGSFYIGNFNFDQWYNFRVVITPTTTTSGTADWYMDGVLVNAETYSGRSPVTQTSNLDVFDIFNVSDGDTTTGALMYFDNLLIQSILPEPSSAALLALGGLLLLHRRSRA